MLKARCPQGALYFWELALDYGALPFLPSESGRFWKPAQVFVGNILDLLNIAKQLNLSGHRVEAMNRINSKCLYGS